MRSRFVLGPLMALILACPAAEPQPRGNAKSEPAKPPPIATPDPPKPEPEPSVPEPVLPSLDGAPAVPAVKVLAATTECPALAKLPDDAPAAQRELIPMVELLRGLACQPALFGQPMPAILAALAPPEGLELDVGRYYAEIDLSERAEPIAVADLLAAAGITDAKLKFEQGFTSSWEVVDAGGEPPTLWAPGELHIDIKGSRNDDTPDGTLADVTPESTVASLRVVMPETAIEFETDPYASAALLAALTRLAENPSTIDGVALPSLGERFTTSFYSVGTGAEQREGVTIRPHRTELRASELSQAMGLTNAGHETLHVTDTNPNRMTSAGETPFVWRGMSVEIELDDRPGTHLGLADWNVTEILVLPPE